MKRALFSWKTTLGGVIGIGTVIASHTGYLTPEQATEIYKVAIAFGLVAAKDAAVTGGSIGQPSTREALSHANQAPSISRPPLSAKEDS